MRAMIAAAERPDWRAAIRAERERAVAAVRGGHPDLTVLRGTGERIRAASLSFGKLHDELAADRRLSPEGIRIRRAEIAATAEKAFGEILSAAARAKAAVTRPSSALTLGPEDAVRVQALVTVLPSWPAAEVVAALKAAVEEGDRPVLRYVLPAVRERSEMDSRYANHRLALEEIAADAELRLATPTDVAMQWAVDEADRLWDAMLRVVGAVDANGGRWDPVFYKLLESFEDV
jgi:hypothetical protein